MIDPAAARARATRTLAVCLLGAALLAACDSQLGESFADMYEIRGAIIELSRAEDVGVHIRNRAQLTVNLVNSPLNDDTAAARRKLAETVARKAVAMYRARESLERIFVVYVFYERKYVLVTHTRTIEAFEFDASALRA